MSPSPFPRAARIAATLILAIVAALACERAHVPLPWMIGPLLATALASVLGAPVETAAPLRFRLDEATRRRGLRHVAEIRARLERQAA